MLYAGTKLVYYKAALSKNEVNELVNRMWLSHYPNMGLSNGLSKGPGQESNQVPHQGPYQDLSQPPNKRDWFISSYSQEELLHKMYVFCRRIQRLVKDERPCLVRSLILFEVCMARGIDAHLVIGAGLSQDNLEGHAWIEVGGVPFMENEETLSCYTEMLRYAIRLPGRGENNGVT